MSTCFAGTKLGVHSGDCRRRRRSAGGAGAASTDCAGSCSRQSSPHPETDSRPSLQSDQRRCIGRLRRPCRSACRRRRRRSDSPRRQRRLSCAAWPRAARTRPGGPPGSPDRSSDRKVRVRSVVPRFHRVHRGQQDALLGHGCTAGRRIRPRRQGMAQPAHAGSLPTDHRSAGTDRTLRHGIGAPALAFVRQDVARGERAVGSSLRTAGRCGTLHDDEPPERVCVAG